MAYERIEGWTTPGRLVIKTRTGRRMARQNIYGMIKREREFPGSTIIDVRDYGDTCVVRLNPDKKDVWSSYVPQ
jgi:hypothetical protein